jgi:hypothetical protein
MREFNIFLALLISGGLSLFCDTNMKQCDHECNHTTCTAYNTKPLCCSHIYSGILYHSCYCVNYNKRQLNISIADLIPEFKTRKSNKCLYNHQHYSHGSVIRGYLVCFADGSWYDCSNRVSECINYSFNYNYGYNNYDLI